MAVQVSLREKGKPVTPATTFDFETSKTPIRELKRVIGRRNTVLNPIEGLPINVFQGQLPDRIEIAGTYPREWAGLNPFGKLKGWSLNGTIATLTWHNQGLALGDLSDWQVAEVSETHTEWFEETGQQVPWRVVLVRNKVGALTLPAPVVPDIEAVVPLLPLPRITVLNISYPIFTGTGGHTGAVLMTWQYTNEDVDAFGWQTARATADPANVFTIRNPELRSLAIEFLNSVDQPDYGQLSRVRMWPISTNPRQASGQDSEWVYGWQPYRVTEFQTGTIPGASLGRSIHWRPLPEEWAAPLSYQWQIKVHKVGDDPPDLWTDFSPTTAFPNTSNAWLVQIFNDPASPIRNLVSGDAYNISIRAISQTAGNGFEQPIAYGNLNLIAV